MGTLGSVCPRNLHLTRSHSDCVLCCPEVEGMQKHPLPLPAASPVLFSEASSCPPRSTNLPSWFSVPAPRKQLTSLTHSGMLTAWRCPDDIRGDKQGLLLVSIVKYFLMKHFLRGVKFWSTHSIHQSAFIDLLVIWLSFWHYFTIC